ncbi:unnamed protein product, partial [Didymodactylos carnosus]
MLNSHSSSTKKTTNERHKLDPKLFQMNWLTYQLGRFVFMLTDNNCSHIPSSFDSKVEKDQYFSKYFEAFYSIFVGFWSRHKVLTEKGLTKCKVDTCSQVFISDGHQKASRSVCVFDNICDISIPELGPILVGCCGTPMKAIKNGIKQVNTRYCSNHQTPQQRKETSQADRHSNKFIQISNDEKAQVQEMTVISHENLNESSMTNEPKLEDIKCEIFRSDYETHQKPSYGFLTSFHNCHVIIGFDESARAEG